MREVAERRLVRPSLDGSIERRLHDAGVEHGVVDRRSGALEPLEAWAADEGPPETYPSGL